MNMEKQAEAGMERLPAVPLITCDPYFSIWSAGDCLYESETVHWSGQPKPIRGTAVIDGKEYRFMGLGSGPHVVQTGLELTATGTQYRFAAGGVGLEVRFWTPLLPDDLDLMSRPCCYLDAAVYSEDGATHNVRLRWEFSAELCYDGRRAVKMGGGSYACRGNRVAWMGNREQHPLGHSGDGVTIDWGYLYLAAKEQDNTLVCYRKERSVLCAEFELLAAGTKQEASLTVAYDDIASIFYFGRMMPGYWARNGKGILEILEEAAARRGEIRRKCDAFEAEMDRQTGAIGEAYRRVCIAAYRQAIAAHKLIADEQGQPVLVSKECYSNGCAGTVDVSYPSSPLFFCYNPELVRAMLRPVLRFADMPVWDFDFAPHDVGRYPYVSGQVYGLKAFQEAAQDVGEGEEQGCVYPMYYQMPAEAHPYERKNQMPVEECGNMLIMAAELARLEPEREKEEIETHLHLYERWAGYLLRCGSDPGEQLCTDDFGGHLAHNVNLAVKAIMGIESYSILLKTVGKEEEGKKYHSRAADMARDAYLRALSSADKEGFDLGGKETDHTKLTFDGDGESWSMKYNAVWDLIFESELWPKEFYKKETAYYRGRQNPYGIPLDSRADYTKSDWMMWCAAMEEEPEAAEQYAEKILRFLQESPDRVPFCDWYDTISGKQVGFQNRTVQGGIFMPLLRTLRK